MDRKLPSRAIASSYVLPVATAAAAIAIFVLDTIATLEIAVAVLFVAVVLMAARLLRTRGVLLVALGCAALAVLSHLMSRHGDLSITALVNLLIGLTAIGIATYLASLNQSAEMGLKEQASFLDVTHDGVFVRDLWATPNAPRGAIF